MSDYERLCKILTEALIPYRSFGVDTNGKIKHYMEVNRDTDSAVYFEFDTFGMLQNVTKEKP